MKDSDSGLRFIDCDEEQHAAAILAILNDAIVNSTALYDYVPRPPEAMVSWFATKRANGFPVVGVIDDAGTLMGFATWGTFRAFPA
ncbi:GNAT family N-acetyltransferase, partial [Providencia rettgeri]|nr:GNAT family N-acetyltransferase [Providencia rettgeri]